MEGEIRQSREQVESMRVQFIQDLRDLYDRIGASLYRFERAAEETPVAPIQEPTRPEPAGAEPMDEPIAATPPPAEQPAEPAAEPEFAMPEPELPELHPAMELGVTPTNAGNALEQPPAQPAVEPTVDEPAMELPEGAKPPAWQQLPPEAWGTVGEESGAEAATGLDEFAVVEDEPLAPGEPLVDLRDMQQIEEPIPGPSAAGLDDAAEQAPVVEQPDAPAAAPAAAEPEAPQPDLPSADDAFGSSWLSAAETPADSSPQDATPEQPAAEVVDAAPPAAEGGSWLLDEPADIAGSSDPATAHDDALAEALIAGTPFGEEEAAGNGAAPDAAPHPEAEPLAGASPDAVAVRQLILDSLAEGQSREAIETYLRDHMGFMEPGALVDAAITSAGSA
jgi:hypothetical protein